MSVNRSAAPLGPEVASWVKGSLSLHVYRGGVAIEQQGRRGFTGTWDELASVAYQQTQITVNGIPLPKQFALTIRTGDGQAFAITTMRGEGREACEAIAMLSAPVMARKSLTAFEAGKDVDFGAVKLSRQRLAVKGMFGWKEIPFEQIAGYVVREGYLFVDRNPDRPRLFLERMMGTIANLSGFEAILAKHRPSSNLSIEANVRASMAKAGKLPWDPPIAATRQGGTATGRLRVIILMSPVALALLYAVLALPAAIHRNRVDAAVIAAGSRTVALGDRAGGEIGDGTRIAGGLAAACRDKLKEAGPETFALYFVKAPAEQKEVPSEELVTINSYGGITTEDARGRVWRRMNGIGNDWEEALLDPFSWFESNEEYGTVDTRPVHHLLVARVTRIQREKKTVDYRVVQELEADVAVRVIDVQSGKTVCEGAVHGVSGQTMENSYSHLDSFMSRPLAAICDAGGAKLCEATALAKN